MRVYVEGRAVRVKPTMAIGKGGEADVFALPDGRALKLFKPPNHPDLSAFPADQVAAAARLAEHQTKLPAFPSGLCDRVVAPIALATRGRGGDIVGYVMRQLTGARSLMSLCDPRERRKAGAGMRAIQIARDLHGAVGSLHRAGVVIGDFNDLNVLVESSRAYLIDADSFQYGAWRCNVFTERFVDPTLCDPTAPAPLLCRPHTEASDWYAFAIMVMRLLICVGPYGGVHRPAQGSRVAHAARSLRRITLFRPDVVAPKPALPFGVLPDDLLHYLRAVFERDRRGPFPEALLERLRFTECSACGTHHARLVCPGCTRRTKPAPPIVVRGSVRARKVPLLPPPDPHSNPSHRYWISSGGLYRDGALGPVRIGSVLPTARFWVGNDWGIGFYRAGRLTVGFCFDSERTGLDDRLRLPPLAGKLVDAHAVVGDHVAWLILLEQHAGRLTWRCVVVAKTGERVAAWDAPADPDSWQRAAKGAVAVQQALFVPTDDGIVRVELEAGTAAITRRFPDTEPVVDSCHHLALGAGGLIASGPDRAMHLTIQ